MTLVAEYEIDCEQLPLVTVAGELSDATVDVDLVASADGHIPFVVHVTGSTDATVEAAFEDAAFVAEYTLVGSAGERRRYKVQPSVGMDDHYDDDFDVAALRELASTDAVVDYIRVTPTGWVQHGWFADRDVLEAFRSFWQRNGDGFTLRRLSTDGPGDPGRGLTPRQREALLVAHELGYFDIPRTASLEDVAGELDITPSALSERLRRAHAHLVETVVDEPASVATA